MQTGRAFPGTAPLLPRQGHLPTCAARGAAGWPRAGPRGGAAQEEI